MSDALTTSRSEHKHDDGLYNALMRPKEMKMTWKIQDGTTDKKGYIRILDGSGGNVCDIFPFGAVGGLGLDVSRANARKIVNADQTFDALNGLLDWVKEDCPEGGRYAITEAEAAIRSVGSG